MTQAELREEIDRLLWLFWEELPEPKPNYTEWFYGDGRFFDLLNMAQEAEA